MIFDFFFFSPDARGKWRKRKREPQISRRQQKHEDDEEEEEDAEDDLEQREDDSDGLHHNPQSGAAATDPGPQESEVLDGGVRCCDFPLVVRHAVNRPHQSVLSIVALERANQCGDSRAQALSSPLLMENLSYGQLQALSAVPADSPALDQDRSDGGNSAYVITPPPIMEGRGVVKRFGSRVLVVPMHSGSSTRPFLSLSHAHTYAYASLQQNANFPHLFNPFPRVGQWVLLSAPALW